MAAGAFNHLFGQKSKQRVKTYTEQTMNPLEKVDEYICNPLATNKADVEEIVKVYASSMKNGDQSSRNNNNDVISGHPWNDQICCASHPHRERGPKIWWQYYNVPTDKETLIDNTDWEDREKNIKERMGKYPEVFKSVIDKCNWHKIPEGTNSIECSFDDDKEKRDLPFIFTLSFARTNGTSNDAFFDMVVIPHGKKAKKLRYPLYYRKCTRDGVIYEHSGDVYKMLDPAGNRHGLNRNLLQTLTINQSSYKRSVDNEVYASGCIAFHGYLEKSLFQLACTEPSICIVDKKPNSDEYDIWIYHLPIIEEHLRDTTVAFLARFDIDCNRKKIVWNFTKTPTFIADKFSVGHTTAYKSGVDNLYGKLQTASETAVTGSTITTKTMEDIMGKDDASTSTKKRRRRIRMTITNGSKANNAVMESLTNKYNKKMKMDSTTDDDDDDDYDEDEEEEEIKKKKYDSNNRPYLLIVQEPILTAQSNANDFVKYISDYIQIELKRDCKKYSFHSNIKKLKDEHKYDGSYDECRYSLPIAGGSVIAKGGLVQTCKPIEGGEGVAKEYLDDLQACQGAIVVASSNYSIADIPEVYFKLNACYVIVNNDEPNVIVEGEEDKNNYHDEKKKNNEKHLPNKAAIDRLLNNTNTSMANVQQGPLSCIVGYFPNYDNGKCYFMRGFAGKHSDEIKFGSELKSIGDVVKLASVTETKMPMRFFTFSNCYSFRDDCGNRVFDVNAQGPIRGENLYYQLETAAHDWANATFNNYRPRFSDNFKTESYTAMNNYLSCILAQMEVLFDARVLREIFDIAKDNLKKISNGGHVGRQKPTRRYILEMLRENKEKDEKLLVSKKKINQLLADDEYSKKDYDLAWLTTELRKDDDSSFFNGKLDSDDYFKIINMVVDCNKKFITEYSKGAIVLPTENIIKKTFLSLLVVKSRECFSIKSSYGKRGLDVGKILQREEIRENVARVNNINKNEGGSDDEFDSLFERGCKRHGYLIFTIDPEKLKETITANTISKLKEKDGVKIFDFLRVEHGGRFMQSEDAYVSSYLLSSKNHEKNPTDGYVFKYNDKYMIAIPILDQIIGIMENENGQITAYPWYKAETGGLIDYARILLRQSVYNLIEIHAGEIKNKNNLLQNPSSPLIGHLVMGLLTSAAHALIEFYKPSLIMYSDESLFVNGLRGIFGLLISVMASGADHPLNPSYQCLMHDVKNRLVDPTKIVTPVKFNFSNGKYWLTQFMEIEPHVRLKGVNIKENVMSNVILKLKRHCQTMLDTSEISKEICNRKREDNECLEKRITWEYYVVRQLVWIIINKQFENWMKFDNEKNNDVDFFRFDLADDKTHLSDIPRLALNVVNTNTDVFVPYCDSNDECNVEGEKTTDADIDRIEREIMIQIEENRKNTGHRKRKEDEEGDNHQQRDLLMLQEEKEKDLISNILEFLERYCDLIRIYGNDIPKGSKFNQTIYELAKLIGATKYCNDNVNDIIQMNRTKLLIDATDNCNATVDEVTNSGLDNSNARPVMECIKKTWRHVKSIAFDKSMRQTGIFCVFIRKVLINSLNNVVKEFLRHTSIDIEKCNQYLANKCFLGDLDDEKRKEDEEEKERERNKLIKATVDFRRNRAKLFKIFLLMRNPYYKTSYIPPVITALALSTSLQNIIHIYIGLDDVTTHFCKLRGNDDCLSAKKNECFDDEEIRKYNNPRRQKKQQRKEVKKSKRTKADVENRVKMKTEMVEAIKNDEKIKLHCSEPIEQHLKGLIQESIENFNHFNLKQIRDFERKDENKKDAIEKLEKSRDLEIMRDGQVVMMNEWLRENCGAYKLIKWGGYAKFLCLSNMSN